VSTCAIFTTPPCEGFPQGISHRDRTSTASKALGIFFAHSIASAFDSTRSRFVQLCEGRAAPEPPLRKRIRFVGARRAAPASARRSVTDGRPLAEKGRGRATGALAFALHCAQAVEDVFGE